GGTLRALMAGERAQRPIALFDVTGLEARVAAEVTGFRVGDVAPAGEAERWSRSDALAVVAAREALAEARLTRGTPVSLIVGATTGGAFETEHLLVAMLRDPTLVPPRSRLLPHPISATADRLCEAAWPFDRTLTLTSACSSGANAIALADAWIRAGRASRVLVGGTDALCRLTFVGFNLLAAMDPAPCKPFDARRAGMNLGEGAAFLLLERADEAQARGAVPIAELAGWAIGSEGKHITQPEPDGTTAARLMRSALARGRIDPRDVGYINAHGTATVHNDRAECAALHLAFGESLATIPVSSNKGQIGHTLGAAGAIEAAITALSLRDGVVTPTCGLVDPDPLCDAQHVLDRGRHHRFRAAISSSFGFGGSDTVLAITEPGVFEEPLAPRDLTRRRLVITSASTHGPAGLQDAPGSANYLDPGPAPAPGASPFTPEDHLDPGRARRLDERAARLTATVAHALGTAVLPDRARVGLVNGVGLRALETAQFLAPIFEQGWRAGKPAIFPSLLLSSPAGHASVYLGLHGPVFTTSDLAASPGTAVACAADLIVAGEADAVVASGGTAVDRLFDQALGPACLDSATWRAPRTEGTSAVVIETEEHAASRGVGAIAVLAGWWSGVTLKEWLPPAPAQSARAIVVLSREDETLVAYLGERGWAGARVILVAPRSGDHEAVGGIALAAAVGALAAGRVDEALVVERTPGRWTATLLGRAL
ncbi:MAG: beta-ketoacyl-[acyl-carrier-protein] synthase family protein, partial [Byssovorax sp.]